MIEARFRALARRWLPLRTRRWLRRRVRRVWPPIGFVRFGGLRRLTPISRTHGGDRGLPIDRYYIEDFLSRHAGKSEYVLGDIRGRVLEVGDDYYARRFGATSSGQPGAVERIDVLHVDESNPQATIVADLTAADRVPANTFDCVLCTQTLLLIYDLRAAIGTLHRILKPGGVLLATVPGISQICRPDVDLWGDYWRFTSRSARRLFEEAFPAENVTVEAYGNVLSSIAFLHGLATEELKRKELDLRDPDYELVVAIRAVKEGRAAQPPA
jgi:SAM-dependent methyltransferase